MDRIVRLRSLPESVSHSSAAFRSCLDHSIHFIKLGKVDNGSPTVCRILRDVSTISVSSNPCGRISSIMLRHNCWCRQGIHVWDIRRSDRGLFTVWVQRIRTCQASSCCFLVARTPMAENNCGVPDFFLAYIRECSAAPTASPCFISTIPKV